MSAPAAAVQLGAATFCGTVEDDPTTGGGSADGDEGERGDSDDRGQRGDTDSDDGGGAARPSVDAMTPRRCFLDAHLAHQPAVLVEVGTTVEGDPVVAVHRTDVHGGYDALHDGTRDRYGPGTWAALVCSGLASPPSGPTPQPADRFVVDGCSGDDVPPESLQVLAGTLTPPAWFSERAPLPLCGVVLDGTAPPTGARGCFRAAVQRGERAELAYRLHDGEGRTAYWVRSLGPDGIEVIERHQPPTGTRLDLDRATTTTTPTPTSATDDSTATHHTGGPSDNTGGPSSDAGGPTWSRYRCDRIDLGATPTDPAPLPRHPTEGCTLLARRPA